MGEIRRSVFLASPSAGDTISYSSQGFHVSSQMMGQPLGAGRRDHSHFIDEKPPSGWHPLPGTHRLEHTQTRPLTRILSPPIRLIASRSLLHSWPPSQASSTWTSAPSHMGTWESVSFTPGLFPYPSPTHTHFLTLEWQRYKHAHLLVHACSVDPSERLAHLLTYTKGHGGTDRTLYSRRA